MYENRGKYGKVYIKWLTLIASKKVGLKGK